MALEQKLSLKLAQRLVMTPSLQQAIKLLQMTRLELDGVLTKEMEENPVLEEGTLSEEEASSEDTEEEKESSEEAMNEIDLDAYFGEYGESWEGSTYASVYEHRQGPPLENILTRQPDLYDHLLFQLHMMDVPPAVREIAEFIIGNLDNEGYLRASIEEIMALGALPEDAQQQIAELDKDAATAEAVIEAALADLRLQQPAAKQPASATSGPETEVLADPERAAEALTATAHFEEQPTANLDAAEFGNAEPRASDDPQALASGDGYSRDEVKRVLALVRSLDPPGIACGSLQESLLFQLDRRGEPEDSLSRQLIADHWPAFKKRKFEAIARALGLPLAKLKPAVDTIRGLETRPGREFNTDRTHYVEPDVYLLKVGEKYIVQINDDGMPRLRVSRAYRKMLKQMAAEGRQAEAQQFIKEKMRSAVWLIKSLDQRQRTIYKVANSIAKQQRAFLDYGIDHLRPMVLRNVAEDIEMHESTVSRVVSNKYIHTPRGLFPMKFFFHSGIDREYGGDISSLTVKRKLEHLIADENNRKPLSDSELMRILNREGIHIARRTVAKYRDELGIASSTERKKIF